MPPSQRSKRKRLASPEPRGFGLRLMPVIQNEGVTHHEAIARIEALTERNFISYSSFFQHPAGIIDDNDPRLIETLLQSIDLSKYGGTLDLMINSPGGTVTSSDIIYREISKFKEDKKLPVIACIMELAASGGYYVALSADTIIAHPTSVTGSIGVIALKFNAKGLMEKIGIEDETIKAGDKKDFLSPLRPMTKEEREILQNMLDDFHERFMDIVAEGRKELAMDQIRVLADGRVYSAKQAFEVKLIDGIGYLDDVIELVKKRAGIDKARVIIYHRPYSYKNNIYSRMTGSDFKNINLVNLDLGSLLDDMGLRFMYLWLP